MPNKERNTLRGLDVPWITKDGFLDFSKFPIDAILKQSLDKDDEQFRSACTVLTSMYSSGRTEAAVFLYGLLALYRNDTMRKEVIVDALGQVKTAESADLLFRELNQTESSNSTRGYITAILKSLSHFPLNLVEGSFNAMLNDNKWSYRMKRKFREILEPSTYGDWGPPPDFP